MKGLQQRIHSLLDSDHLPRERRGKRYDLRPLIEDVRLEESKEGQYVVAMTLKAGEGGTGRSDEVLDELGLADRVLAVTRTRLNFS